MSYDLEVATHHEPAPEAVSEALRAQPGVGTEGELRGESGNVLVLRDRRGGRVSILTVDSPFRVEIDDLADPLAEAVVAPRWLLQLSTPAGRSTSDQKLALRLARHLAEEGAGAVYDPQEDKVVWPRRRRRYRAAGADERIRVVNLEWFFPPSRAEGLPAQWSERVERLLPEALPVRYGDFEPLQNRVETVGLDGFRAFWRKQAEAPYGAHFFWKGTPPCYEGAVWLPDPRPPGPWWSPAAARHISVKVRFDGRAMEDGGAWRAAVVTLFRDVAALGAFFAAGYVTRNVVARRGKLWYDGETESIHLSRMWWEGLPPHPTWLAWFGDPYRERVGSSVRSRVTEELPGGLFIRIGEAPLDRDELERVSPALPEELVWKPKPPGGGKHDPSLRPEREEEPAAFIPVIE